MLPLEQPLLIGQRTSPLQTLNYRPLKPDDFLQVKAAHAALFPIDYDDSFFHKATNALDRIWSCAAFSVGPYKEEQLVGFITAKTVFLHECETTDRQHMGLLSPIVDHDLILYILTLGVLEGWRHRGIAASLIQAVCQHACETRCRAVFLHVITYNTAAMSLYSRQGFTCVARLSNFYYIATGRQPDPSTLVYDAYLYVQYIGGPGGLVSPWDMITLAWSPLRSALGRIHSCMPGFCRQQQQQQVHQYPSSSLGAFPDGAAASADHSRSRSSSNSNSCSYQQLELEQQQQQPPPYSRQRYRRGPAAYSPSSELMKQQQQQQHEQQQVQELLSPLQQQSQQAKQQQQQQQQYPQQLQQQQHHGYQQHALPHRPSVQQQHHHQHHPHRQHPPPQRMLRWLFNAQSRPGLMAQQQRLAAAGQQQQLSDGQQQVQVLSQGV